MHHTFRVQGMTCGHCEMAVKKAITRLDPAAKVSIDRPLEKVDIESDQPKDRLIRVITDEGYAVV
jgi:copper chaperone